jgi:hypothetical protein
MAVTSGSALLLWELVAKESPETKNEHQFVYPEDSSANHSTKNENKISRVKSKVRNITPPPFGFAHTASSREQRKK